MTEVTKYKCDVCGAIFDNRGVCYVHEASHKIHHFFETEGAKFYVSGRQVSASHFKSLDAFFIGIDAIKVFNSDAATIINNFYRDNKYCEPFKNVNSKRVYFDAPSGEWVDADRAIKDINSNFGEE